MALEDNCLPHPGSALFVLALNYKQMSLYYALPFFSFLLSKTYNQRSWAGFKQVGLKTTDSLINISFKLENPPFKKYCYF